MLGKADQLAKLTALVDGLDYGAAEVLTQQLLARDDLTNAERIIVLATGAQTAAILNDSQLAETRFAELLELDPEFALSADAEPKILAPFRSAQVAFREYRAAAKAAELRSRIAAMQLDGGPSGAAVGGQSLVLDYTLVDPSGSTTRLDLNYRRQGEREYALLPFVHGAAGAWQVAIPGDWTASQHDYLLEYYVQARSSDGSALVSAGSAPAPLTTSVTAGELTRARPFYRSVWFWAAVGVGVAGVATGAYVIHHNATALPDSDLGTVRVD